MRKRGGAIDSEKLVT